MTIFNEETTTLHVIRHGETSWNVQKIVQGHMDIALNDKGREQAKNLIKKLEKLKLSHCYTSDLLRASETAKIALSGRKIPITEDRRLRERTFGKWEGKSFDAYYHSKPYRGGSVETDEAIRTRIRSIVNDIVENHPNQEILISTHGGIIRILLSVILDTDIQNIHVHNTAYLRITYKNHSYNIEEMDGIIMDCDCGHHGS